MRNGLTANISALFSNLAAPQTCTVCGVPSISGIPLCEACMENRFYHEARSPRQLRCASCGHPLLTTQNRCVSCRLKIQNESPLDGLHVLFPYDSANQTLLTTWKISGLRQLSLCFSRCFALALKRFVSGSYAIVPVPPRPGKIHERGWDQMEEIAGLLERSHGMPVIRPLERLAGIQQKKLGHEGRLTNLKGAITCKKSSPFPETLFVIDDLTATGSTLEVCAEALKSAGAGKVYGLALFYD